jgi:type I restriction-modification system DNA methylase subunit
MALFQKSVQKKFINALDKTKVEAAYQRLLVHFGNPIIQENIRLAKEEQYQEGFLNQLFVEILGYRMSPQPFFNLITEQKNEKNSKKADGAILKNEKAIAVIELKSLKTVDLQSIELQAFSYKNNQSQCVYVITSNFQKVRFYIENAIDWEEFDLFHLSKERFQLLYLCLHAEHLLADLPLRVKKDSLEKEEDITKKLYNDYAGFKKALFKDILSKDKSLDKLLLFKKTQKLLDRFLFIFFAEDKGLLQPNTVREIVNQWNTLKDLDAYQPLYNRFKQYFAYLNHGHQTPQYSIFAYNGGLFAPDAFLDNLTISDGLLYNYTQLLSGYDFETDVDTNILGHIFEHSLNETDEIAASATNATIDKSKTKRKKDGIFYTPRYITKYIVENTVGALCQRKLDELGIDPNNIDIHADKETKNAVCKKIHRYRDWLLSITILDPACGSGAFLNQALTFLMEEHQRIDAMFKSLYDVPISLTDNVIQILENNIFGVDINEESVEIARLSLWLRTAKVGRKLNDLSRNVLCGNSLISDPDVAGASAFDWQKAFPQVFEKGGFDVVIGNPPYVVYLKSIFGEKALNYVNKHYNYAEYNPNTYALFTELALKLLKPCGFLGFIIPNSWMHNKYFSKMRNGVYSKQVQEIVYLKNTVFQEVVETVIILLQNIDIISDGIKLTTDIIENKYIIQKFNIENYKTGYNPFIQNTNSLIHKLDAQTILKDFAMIYRGLETTNNEKWITTALIDENHKPILLGKDVNKYFTQYSGSYVNFIKEATKSNANETFYSKNKILMRRTGSSIIANLDFTKIFALKNLYLIIPKDENDIYSILGQLNSKLLNYYHKCKTSAENKAFAQFSGEYIEQFPYTVKGSSAFKVVIEQMLSLHAQLQEAQTEFNQLLLDNFTKITINRAIENWHQGDFGAFKKVLEKQKIEIPLKKQKEWRELFETEKTAYHALQTQIATTETAIDKMVYALYELTAEEIQIIENQ